MAIWDFSDYSYQALIDKLEDLEEIDIIEDTPDDDRIKELRVEIKKREEDGYQHLVTFNACNNDTYQDVVQTILFYELPVINDKRFFKYDIKEIEKMVKDTYDGVWEPDIKTIEVFDLNKVVF